MYGLVLLMAVTAGSESADLGRRNKGCCGCTGYVAASCRGCYGCGGCYAPKGCYGCSGCSYVVSAPVVKVGCYGCVGAPVMHGYTGCTGVIVPSCGGTIVPPKTGKKTAYVAPTNAATVVVSLPADAKLTIDGEVTTSTSTERVFQSPELVSGKTYAYTLEASFEKEGKTVTVTKKVSVAAGKVTEVDLNKESTKEAVAGVVRN